VLHDVRGEDRYAVPKPRPKTTADAASHGQRAADREEALPSRDQPEARQEHAPVADLLRPRHESGRETRIAPARIVR
jgi:hypothetical protein